MWETINPIGQCCPWCWPYPAAGQVPLLLFIIAHCNMNFRSKRNLGIAFCDILLDACEEKTQVEDHLV